MLALELDCSVNPIVAVYHPCVEDIEQHKEYQVICMRYAVALLHWLSATFEEQLGTLVETNSMLSIIAATRWCTTDGIRKLLPRSCSACACTRLSTTTTSPPNPSSLQLALYYLCGVCVRMGRGTKRSAVCAHHPLFVKRKA